MRRWLVFLSIITLIFVSCAGCKHRNEYDKGKDIPQFDNPEKADLRDVYGLMVTIHGCPLYAMNEMLKEGMLPNIKKYIVDRGATVKQGVCCFPSLSSPNGPAIFLGRFPGHIGIPELQWVDRWPHFYFRNYIGPDYDKANVDFYSGRATDYDDLIDRKGAPVPLCAKIRPYTTAAYQEFFSAGATEVKYFAASVIFEELFSKNNAPTDMRVLNEVKKTYMRPRAEVPRLVCIDLLGFDIMAHRKHPLHKKTKKILANIDKQIGEIVEILKKQGLWDKTYILLFADHGNKYLEEKRKKQSMTIPLYLRRYGFRPWHEHKNDSFNVASTASGINTSMIYFAAYNVSAVKVNYNWKKRPTLSEIRNYPVSFDRRVDAVKALLDDQRIKFVLASDEEKNVRIFAKDSEAVIKRRIFMGAEYFSYQKIRGKVDPFEYGDIPAVKPWVESAEYISERDWLEKTLKSKYPYAVPNVFQIFDNRRTGDLMAVASDNVVMKKSIYDSTHGALSPQDVLVPMFFSGPDIKQMTVDYARVIDIYPTWLRIFGMKVPFDNIDGRPLDSIFPAEIIKNTDERIPARKKFIALVRAVWELETADLAKVNNPKHNPWFETLVGAPKSELAELRKYFEAEEGRLPSHLKELPKRYIEIIDAASAAKK